jgi:hypothetical protein
MGAIQKLRRISQSFLESSFVIFSQQLGCLPVGMTRL